MSLDNTQITSAYNYDTKNLIFLKPKDGSIPNSAVTFKRILMGTKNPDGSSGELIIETERLFSFGVAPNTNMQTGKTDGYTVSLCMWDMDAPTQKQKNWTDMFSKICDAASEYVLEHRDDIGKYELEKADLKKFNPLFFKRDKGKIVEGTGPMLYVKLLQNKKTDTITSIFYNEQGRDIEPMSLLNQRCLVKAAIKIEGIFIGSKVSLQIKLHEAEIKLKDNGVKRLMRPSNIDAASAESSTNILNKNNLQDDDAGSLKGDDEEDEDDEEDKPSSTPVPTRAPSPPPAKATVRRIAKK